MDAIKKRAAILFGNISVNDNAIFAVCTKGTTGVFLVAVLCVVLGSNMNGQIECNINNTNNKTSIISDEFVNRLCYVNGTFNVDDADDARNNDETAFKFMYHYQYGWIAFLLQAIISYVPFYVWSVFEGRQIEMLSNGLKNPTIERETKEKRISQLAEYMSVNINHHNGYAFKFFFCEILCFGVIMGQAFILNYLLNGQFYRYGWNVIFRESEANAKIFPLVASCYFYHFKTTMIASCLLSLNGIYDKVFFILWCWVVGVMILASFALKQRLLICLSPRVRTLVLSSKARLSIERETEPALNKLQIGDFFFLHQLSKNVSAYVFKEFLQRLINQTSPYKQMSVSLDQDSLEEAVTGTI